VSHSEKKESVSSLNFATASCLLPRRSRNSSSHSLPRKLHNTDSHQFLPIVQYQPQPMSQSHSSAPLIIKGGGSELNIWGNIWGGGGGGAFISMVSRLFLSFAKPHPLNEALHSIPSMCLHLVCIQSLILKV
jgi:hypothetical protein